MFKVKLMIISAAAACLAACSGTKEQPATTYHNVFTINPEPAGTAGVMTLPAIVEESRSISVGFKTAGQIERIYVKEGQHVTAGQPLALLDTTDYALGISTLREKYRQMQIENQRRARLHESGNMSDNDYENAVSGMRQMALQLKLEENKLDYCRLTSPASGVVTKVNFEASEMVDAGTPVIELMDNNTLEIVADMPVRMYAGRENFRAYSGESTLEPGKMIALRFLSLTPRADNAQLYRLRLTPAEATGKLTPGMNIKVTIESESRGNSAVRVPLIALFENNGHTCVWIVNPADSVITARQVTTAGTATDGIAEITSGLSAADVIVRAGVHHLTEGEKVNIITESDTNPGNVI